MKIPRMKSWSFSKWKTYKNCPAQLGFKLCGIPEPQAPAAERGSDIHSMLEGYIEGARTKLPTAVSRTLGVGLKSELLSLRKDQRAEAEVEIAVDRRWRIVPFKDSRAWLRAVFDVRAPHTVPAELGLGVNDIGVRIIDHKTGRERPQDHSEQLELYAVIEFSVNRAVDYVVGDIFYIDHGKKMTVLYNNREVMLGRLRERWTYNAEEMMSDRTFKPNPGRGCSWCAFSRTKGGPCDAG